MSVTNQNQSYEVIPSIDGKFLATGSFEVDALFVGYNTIIVNLLDSEGKVSAKATITQCNTLCKKGLCLEDKVSVVFWKKKGISLVYR